MEERKFGERAPAFVSAELARHEDADRPSAESSKIKKMFQEKSDLKKAFILKEILDRHHF